MPHGRTRKSPAGASWNATCCSNVIDRKWREHLYEMDYLKEGIGLRARWRSAIVGQYQREGYDMFMAMLDGMRESVGFLFNVTVEAVPPPVRPNCRTRGSLPNSPPQRQPPRATAGRSMVSRADSSALRAKGVASEGRPALTIRSRGGCSAPGATQRRWSHKDVTECHC